MSLNGKTAVVTGGSRGIGRAIVQRLAADGARVVYSYQKSKPEVEIPGTVGVRADQEDIGSLEELFAPVRDTGLDILVNNAAVVSQLSIADMTEAEFDRVMTVNAKFPLLAMREAAGLMRDNGRIINISTINTVLPAPEISLYCGSKGALEQFTAVAAREFGPRGITVNTVSPGATDTDMLRGANPPEALEQSAAMAALQRLGRPEDIAAVVAFLAGPDGQWVTGENIRASGGLLV
jgi:3-oxoacyl-[acyl-carrier protein] reductase